MWNVAYLAHVCWFGDVAEIEIKENEGLPPDVVTSAQDQDRKGAWSIQPDGAVFLRRFPARRRA